MGDTKTCGVLLPSANFILPLNSSNAFSIFLSVAHVTITFDHLLNLIFTFQSYSFDLACQQYVNIFCMACNPLKNQHPSINP